MDLDANLRLDGGLRLHTLAKEDAALLVEATSGESARSLWGARPVGPYSLPDARAALAAWNADTVTLGEPGAGGQFSIGVLRGPRLLAAVGLMPDRPGSIELAYWTRPEERGRGIASRAVEAVTSWAHQALSVPRIWLEIRPDNEASLRLAERSGYRYEERLPQHCRNWEYEDAERDSWHDCLVWVHTVTGHR